MIHHTNWFSAIVLAWPRAERRLRNSEEPATVLDPDIISAPTHTQKTAFVYEHLHA